jgi:hypothetical protein
VGARELRRAVEDALAGAAIIGTCQQCGGPSEHGPLALFLPEGEQERHCPTCHALLNQWGEPVGWPQPDGTLHLTLVRRAPPDWYGPRGWSPEVGPRPPMLPPPSKRGAP